MFSEELLKKAESGNAEAALEVANCYYRGIDVEENNDKAFAWFNRILEMDPNNAVALTNPGSCYRGGFGVEQDHCKAVEYYERAFKYDNKGSLWYLAEDLYDGVGAEQNFARAIELYSEKSKQTMSEKIVQFNEEIIKGQLKELIRGSVQEALNELLEQEAEKLTQAARYECNEARQDYRSCHYDRNLTTTSGDVTLHMPRLKGHILELCVRKLVF